MESPTAPLVTVILPVYNGEAYLARAISSVLCQTCQDFELLIINHRSSDGSQPIIDQWAQKYPSKIRVAYLSEGTSVSDPRNYGIHAALGRYITFIDQDDEYLPDMLKSLIDAAVSRSSVVSGCGYEAVDSNGNTLYSKRLAPWTQGMGEVSMYTPGMTWMFLYERSFLLRHDIHFPSGKYAEDTYFNRQVALLAPTVALLPSIGYRAYIRNDSVSHSKNFTRISAEKLPLAEFRNLLSKVCSIGPCNNLDVFYYFVLCDLFCFSFINIRHSSLGAVLSTAKQCADIIRQYLPSPLRNPYRKNPVIRAEVPFFVRIGSMVLYVLSKLHVAGAAAVCSSLLFRLLQK